VVCILFFIREYGVNAVDTPGAGDVFRAGFIYGLLRNREVIFLLEFVTDGSYITFIKRGKEGNP
jgi:sugar/nucleoside kinase (ribokinase family)